MASLTIPNEPTSLAYTVTAAQTIFPFPFAIFDKTDLHFSVNGVELGQGDFVLSGTLLTGGGYQGGTITLNTAVSSCSCLVWREITAQRTSNFSPSPNVPVPSIDASHNRAMAIDQDQNRDLSRAALVPIGETAPALPSMAERTPGYVLGFDPNGTGDLVATPPGQQGPIGIPGVPGSVGMSQLGVSVSNPGTDKLEQFEPVQTVTGASWQFGAADLHFYTRRSNAGVAMLDTLPLVSTPGLTSGIDVVIENSDPSAPVIVAAPTGASVDNAAAVQLEPGRSARFVWDALTSWTSRNNDLKKVIGVTQGNWTPVLTFDGPGDLAVSYSTQVGRYSRSGNQVWLQATIVAVVTFTTATGALRVTGLPMAGNTDVDSGLGVEQFSANNGATFQAWPGGSTSIRAVVPAGATYANLWGLKTGQARAEVTATDCPTTYTVTLEFSGTYQGGFPGVSQVYDYLGTELVPTLVDASLNNLVAVNTETGLAMAPGPKKITVAQLTASTILNMTLHWGQSLAAGIFGNPAYEVSAHGHLMFGSGVKSMKPGNIFGLTETTTPGTTTITALLEDNNYAWDTTSTGGQTSITSSLDKLSVLTSAYNSGFTDANHRWFGTDPARGGEQIVTLIPTGTDWQMVADHMSEFVARAGSAGYVPIIRDFVFTQGNADIVIGTPYATYLAYLLQIIAGADAYAQLATGQTKPVITFINQISYAIILHSGQGVAQAQMDATFQDPRAKMLVPDYFFPHYADNEHLINDGYALRGIYEGRAKFWTFVRDGISAVTGIRPLTARWSGGRVYVKFEVPTAPLQISLADIKVGAAAWAPTFQQGFRMFDGTSDILLSGCRIESDGVTVSFATSRTPVGATTIRAGMDYVSANNPSAGSANTDLKDSTTETVTLNGTTYNTFYPVPHFGMNVVVGLP